MPIKLISFGYKHREPPKADRVVDCRSLPNPYRIKELRMKTGLDAEVQQYLRGTPQFAVLMSHIGSRTFKKDEVVAIGCHGGHHRSVAVAEAVAGVARGFGIEVEVEHMELKAGG